MTTDAAAVARHADGLIDFTIPAASVIHAELAAKAGKVHVLGTTGFSGENEKLIAEAAKRAVIVKSGNMSLGVNLLAALTKRVAATLGEDFDIEIVEMHHNKKIDAPSGTALMLGRAAAEGRGVDLAQRSVRGRDGETGARRTGDIGFASLRGGTVVGDHSRDLRRHRRAHRARAQGRGPHDLRARRGARRRCGRAGRSRGSIRWRTCWASRTCEALPARVHRASHRVGIILTLPILAVAIWGFVEWLRGRFPPTVTIDDIALVSAMAAAAAVLVYLTCRALGWAAAVVVLARRDR